MYFVKFIMQCKRYTKINYASCGVFFSNMNETNGTDKIHGVVTLKTITPSK